VRRRPASLIPAALALACVLLARPAAAPAGEQAPGELRRSVLDVVEDDDSLRAYLGGLAHEGRYRDLMTATSTAIAHRNGAVPAWEYRGYAAQKLGNQGRAWEAYERCIQLDPQNWWSLTQMGHLQARRGRFRDAVRSLTRAIRIKPDSADAHRKLVSVHRDRGKYPEAIAAVRQALACGVDAGWAHLELGYLHWAEQELDESARHWERAAELVKDTEDRALVARGRAMVAFDRRVPREPGLDAAELRERRANGPAWRCRVGDVQVVTRVGPELPEELSALLLECQRTHAALLGVRRPWRASVQLHLARTVEEHEEVRRVRFPGGSRGRAFLDSDTSGPRNGGKRARRGGRGDLRMHVAYPAVQVESSISHELAHALMRLLGQMPAPWLDEGVATYLQVEPRDRVQARLDDLRKALAPRPDGAPAAAEVLPWRSMLTMPGAGFTGPLARARYAQAWSMVHFLLHRDRHGSKGLRWLLSGARSWQAADVARATGRTLDELDREWRAYVRTLTLTKPATPSGSRDSSGR
jgi:tetratricopeptide (TPR) repeat protein